MLVNTTMGNCLSRSLKSFKHKGRHTNQVIIVGKQEEI